MIYIDKEVTTEVEVFAPILVGEKVQISGATYEVVVSNLKTVLAYSEETDQIRMSQYDGIELVSGWRIETEYGLPTLSWKSNGLGYFKTIVKTDENRALVEVGDIIPASLIEKSERFEVIYVDHDSDSLVLYHSETNKLCHIVNGQFEGGHYIDTSYRLYVEDEA